MLAPPDPVMALPRKPPAAVLTILRQEVGFLCPAPSIKGICSSPYLTWHHFDPPWRVEQHHRVDGMIALCPEHAAKADSGAYTDEQLRRYKADAESRDDLVKGQFAWQRQELLAIIGGNAYLQTPVIVEYGSERLVWFNRNEHDELMFNVALPEAHGARRLVIEDNLWIVDPTDVKEVICRPGGRNLMASFVNGDSFHIEFTNIKDASKLRHWFPWATWADKLTYPITLLLFWQKSQSGFLRLGPNGTRVGPNDLIHNLVWGCGVGLHIGLQSGVAAVPTEGLRRDDLE